MTDKIQQFKKVLKIKDEILGVKFSNSLPSKFKHSKDTACTALARAFVKRQTVVFNAKKYPQLCSGADYFLKLGKVCDQEAEDVYINQEKVFVSKKACQKFLQKIPSFPRESKNKYIVIEPLNLAHKPKIVILLVTPAQAGRVLGLASYSQFKMTEIIPNQPTCVCLFAPLITKKPHLNFIDYYDRYYQGKIKGKYIWPEGRMIISLAYKQFTDVLGCLNKSGQGSFKPKISPSRVDDIC